MSDSKTVDPFEMSKEEFQQEKYSDEPIEKKEVETPTQSEAAPQEKEEIEPFVLNQEQKAEESQQDTETLRYNKQDVQLSKEEVDRLANEQRIREAQKGYQHEQTIGKYKDIVKFIDSDPGALQAIYQYANNKALQQPQAQPQVQQPQKAEYKPLSEFQSDDEWVKNNLEATKREVKDEIMREIQPVKQHIERQTSPQAQLQNYFMTKDPDGWQENWQLVNDVADSLPYKDFIAIKTSAEKGDYSHIIKLHDYVLQNKQNLRSGQRPSAQKTSSGFKVRSGGGNIRQTNNNNNSKDPWNMKSSDFKRIKETEFMGY